MKKMLLASAFALFGIYGFAQEKEPEEGKRTCSGVMTNCNLALYVCWYGSS